MVKISQGQIIIADLRLAEHANPCDLALSNPMSFAKFYNRLNDLLSHFQPEHITLAVFSKLH